MRSLLLSALFIVGVSPAALPQSADVTATCKDGTTWSGHTRRGACAGHQGVQTFGAAATTAAPATSAPPASGGGSGTGTLTPAPTTPTQPQQAGTAPGGGAGQVWVNPATRVYHCSGDRHYGRTKQGTYMTEAAAKAAGDRPSRGKGCSQREVRGDSGRQCS